MNYTTKKTIVFLILLSSFFLVASVLAAPTVTLPNPIGPQIITKATILEKMGDVLKVFIGFSGSVALLMFIYGGFMWLTSAGEADKIKKGREIFLWSAIGLVVIFNSYVLLNFVITGILAAAKK